MKRLININKVVSKSLNLLMALCLGGAMSGAFTSCSEWSDHFDQADINASGVEIYNGDIVSYLQSQNKSGELSKMNALYAAQGIFNATSASGNYTFIVVDDANYDETKIGDASVFAKYTVADVAVEPSLLKTGYGIQTRSGKSVWVNGEGTTATLGEMKIKKVVKTTNGFVYYVEGTMPVQKSVYAYLKSLDDTKYSRFKELVFKYDFLDFDREASKVIGVNSQGRTVYDSVFVNRNTLVDRYTQGGVKKWDMFDEQFASTMFIPTNDQIDDALATAYSNVQLWLHHDATASDTLKFEQWIVKACFVDRRLSADEVSATAPQFACTDGYQRNVNEVLDEITYKSVDPAYWNPQVNTINVASKVDLSNGVAYEVNSFKIPNHIVIYRVKSRFYQLWGAMDDAQRAQHFTWTNWQNPNADIEGQGVFTLTDDEAKWPSIYYFLLTAEPTQEAHDNDLECSVEFDGVTYDQANNNLYDVYLPAGEYYLRMGFKHSLTYSLSVSFKDAADVEYTEYNHLMDEVVMYATGSNFHFDRGAASEVPHYGTASGIAYPEGYDVDYWQTQNEKAIAYDTDGYTVGIVKIKKDGNFKIKVSSKDNARLYTYEIGATRSKSNVAQLMMYHWCLRPTINNY